MSSQHQCTATENDGGVRLDKFLSSTLAHLSRARIQQLIAQGHVHMGAACVTNPAKKVKPGEHYRVHEPEVRALDLTPANITLAVVYEDSALLVINKPAGMTVHPAPGAGSQTLVHALLAHCGDSLSGIGGVARPGIVHRIDKDTSGLLVVAKTDEAHHALSAQLKARTLKRTYVCYSWGAMNPREGTVDAPLARHKHKRKQMAVVADGKHATTHYHTETLYRAKGAITPFASKLICQLETGRTHQIRVHLSHHKCPLIGDKLYGLSTQTKLNRLKSSGIVVPEETAHLLSGFSRQALHAFALTLMHPKTGEEMTFSAEIPVDLEALEACLVALTNAA